MNPLAPILCAALPGALCATAHYIPWRYWFKSGRLPRLWAYAAGSLAILLPTTVAALVAAITALDVLALLWLAAGSAALGTLIPWGSDAHKRAEYRHADDAERALDRK